MNLTSHILHTLGMASATIVFLGVAVFLIAKTVSDFMDKQIDSEE